MKNDTTLLLMHGAGMGSWIWDEVRPHLGMPSAAIEFPDRDKGKVDPKITLNDYAEHLRHQINNLDYERFILVPHSISGLLSLMLTEHYKKRVAGIIAISAAFPPKGGSFFSALPFPQNIIRSVMMKMGGTRPPEKKIREGYCNDFNGRLAEEVTRRFVEESPHLYSDECHAKVPDGKKIYVETSADAQLPPKVQLKMAGALNAQRIITIRSGHLPMVGHPREMADVLNQAVEKL